jgi:acetyl-CoA carboxylase carboxyl transferase subunit alpha
MAHPEGYRKALRLMRPAANYGLSDRDPGRHARPIRVWGPRSAGTGGAGAEHPSRWLHLAVPIVTVVTEREARGALAIAVGDVVMMMENSIYSVITPEGCAAILWKDSSKAEQAAEALKLTAPDLLELKVIDEMIPEPLGGAHRDPEEAAKRVKDAVLRHVRGLIGLPAQELLDRRLEKYLKMGVYLEETVTGAAGPPT